MNNRKTILKYLGVLMVGIFIGALLLESLENYLRPVYRDLIIRTNLKTEQAFLASRVARENKLLEAAFHRWTVVNSESDDGFRVFRTQNNALNEDSFLYPLHMLVLKWMSSGENIKRGSKIDEGFNRGKQAAALEALGQQEEADNQWRQAQELIQRKLIKETKDAVFSMLEQEKTDLYKQAADKVLGK